jgi:hypothetical protein
MLNCNPKEKERQESETFGKVSLIAVVCNLEFLNTGVQLRDSS